MQTATRNLSTSNSGGVSLNRSSSCQSLLHHEARPDLHDKRGVANRTSHVRALCPTTLSATGSECPIEVLLTCCKSLSYTENREILLTCCKSLSQLPRKYR